MPLPVFHVTGDSLPVVVEVKGKGQLNDYFQMYGVKVPDAMTERLAAGQAFVVNFPATVPQPSFTCKRVS